MPGLEISTDVRIVNAALAGLGLDPIATFTDDTLQAKVAYATYRLHLEHVLTQHPWNFAMITRRLNMAIPDTADWRWDYRFTLTTDILRIWEVEGQGADVEEEWAVKGRTLVTNLTDNKLAKFNEAVALALPITAHGFALNDAVVVVDVDGLPTGLVEDTIYYVLAPTADTLKLSLTVGGANVISANNGGNGNTLLRRTVNVRSIEYTEVVTNYSPQFITTFVAKLESEWAEPLVKATTLGDRKDAKMMDKLAEARSLDGQEGTPERQDTSTWIDSR